MIKELISDNDGFDHINIYSKANTDIGRMLSNFYKYPIKTKDGDFLSVEGYWYWMSIKDCNEKEMLRSCYGYNAKKVGKELLLNKKSRRDDNFENKILNAIQYKFINNNYLLTPKYYDLPLEHYYNFGGKLLDVRDKYEWMIDGIDVIRKYIVKERKRNYNEKY